LVPELAQEEQRPAFFESDGLFAAERSAKLDEPAAYPQVEAGHREVEAAVAEHQVPSVVSCGVCEQNVWGIRTEQQTIRDQTLHLDRISTSSS
jgi:hypothetical protein